MAWYSFIFDVFKDGRVLKSVDKELSKSSANRRVGSTPSPATERNYMDDVITLRQKLQGAGWQVRELPVRSNDIVKSWKIIAAKGQKSITIGGTTLDEALHNLARAVGVVANVKK